MISSLGGNIVSDFWSLCEKLEPDFSSLCVSASEDTVLGVAPPTIGKLAARKTVLLERNKRAGISEIERKENLLELIIIDALIKLAMRRSTPVSFDPDRTKFTQDGKIISRDPSKITRAR